MEFTTTDVAKEAIRTPRFVQQAVQSGDLPALRLVGRTTVVDDLAARAWIRSLARGRRWSPSVREAALDVLSHGTTDLLTGAQRSRLRTRLRTMSVSQISHASGGLAGGWGRYRLSETPDLIRVGPSAIDPRSRRGGATETRPCPMTPFQYQRHESLDHRAPFHRLRRGRDIVDLMIAEDQVSRDSDP